MKLDGGRLGAALLGVVAALGCSSSAAVPPFRPTAAQGGTPLWQLTPDQVQMVCEEEAQYDLNVASSPAGREAACQGFGWTGAFQVAGQHLTPGTEPSTAELQQACLGLEAGCLRSPPGPITGPPPLPCAQASSLALTGCDATLDQYAACVADLAARQLKESQPCSRLTARSGPAPSMADGGLPAGAPLPASCVTFWASCPPLANKTLESAGS